MRSFRRPPAEVRHDGRDRLRLFVLHVGRFRVQRLPPARLISAVLRKLRFGGPTFDEMGLPECDPHADRGAPRPGPRHRSDGLGQDDDARRDDRAHQPHAAVPHRDDRGPDRGAVPRRRRVDQPARGRQRHGELPVGAPRGAAPGPRRDPDRRDARHRDRPRRAAGGRDRPPRAVDAAHRRCDRDGQPRRRLLPAVPAGADPADARRRAQGHRLPAPGPRESAAAWCRATRSS